MTETRWAKDLMEGLEKSWATWWPVPESLGPAGLEARLPEGRTVKEILAHVAFWEEAAVGYVRGAIRGETFPVEEWFGGEGLELAEGEAWPDADTHNAREAEWAAHRPGNVVLHRLQKARSRLLDLLNSVGEDEANGAVQEYFKRENVLQHFEEHLSEINEHVMSPKEERSHIPTKP